MDSTKWIFLKITDKEKSKIINTENLNNKNFYEKVDWDWTVVLRFWERYWKLIEEYKTLKKMYNISSEYTIKPISFENWVMKLEKINNIIDIKRDINNIPIELRKKVLEVIISFHNNWIYHWDLNSSNIIFYTKDNWEISFKIIDPAGYPENFKFQDKAKQLDLDTLNKTLKLQT